MVRAKLEMGVANSVHEVTSLEDLNSRALCSPVPTHSLSFHAIPSAYLKLSGSGAQSSQCSVARGWRMSACNKILFLLNKMFLTA